MPKSFDIKAVVTLGVLTAILTGNGAVGGAQSSPGPVTIAAYNGLHKDYRAGLVHQRTNYIGRNRERGAKGQFRSDGSINMQQEYISGSGIWLRST
jgi:hypothetical protein